MKQKLIAHSLMFFILLTGIIEGTATYIFGLPLKFIRFQIEYIRIILSNADESIRKLLLPIYAFDFNGLLHSMNHLRGLNLKEVINTWTVEKIATYVDEITFDTVNKYNRGLVKLSNLHLDDNVDIAKINMTSLGNLAYILLYTNDVALRNKALELFNNIKSQLQP